MSFEGLMVDSLIRAFKRSEVIGFDYNDYPKPVRDGPCEIGSAQQHKVWAKVKTADGQVFEILCQKRENMAAVVSITGDDGLAGLVTLYTIGHRGRLYGELFKIGFDYYDRLQEAGA